MADLHESLNAARKKVSGVVSLRELGWRRDGAAFLSTGIKQLDELLGGEGLPVGRMTEFYGSASAGKTGLVSRIMSGVTRRGGCVAYVDFFNSLSPEFLRNAGVELENVLWIRGTGNSFPGSSDQGDVFSSPGDSSVREEDPGYSSRALKQAEILVKSGNFTLVVLDLAESAPAVSGVSGAFRRRLQLPGGMWFRLQRAAEKSRSVLVLLSRRRLTSGASAKVLSLRGRQGIWGGCKLPVSPEDGFTLQPGSRDKYALLQGMRVDLSVVKGGRNGRSVVFHCHI